MGLLSPILRNVAGGRLAWWCPGCDMAHQIAYSDGDGPRWGWNGNAERPTFTPSVLVHRSVRGQRDGICHSFVVDGSMQFLTDCTHALAGQTVPIPPWPQQGS